ncbi:MAG: hypothetical protein HQK53_10135 [Oligoflexia bacterium]|nr:hypothetical protein [Oligoflexia bacterium]
MYIFSKKGDLIAIDDGTIVKIIALPGETVSINNQDQGGKSISSTNQKEVLLNGVAIQLIDKKIISIFKMEKVSEKTFHLFQWGTLIGRDLFTLPCQNYRALTKVY